VSHTDIDARTIGEAWLAVAREILRGGKPSEYDALPILEIPEATLRVEAPASADPIVERLGDPERLDWMHRNFHDHSLVAALGDARSYASRLYDYAGSGRNQLDWVIDRIRTDPTTRSAVITTFEPLLDTSYIPCVSLMDFWLQDGALDQLVYAHSIDFGAKGYGNLVELAFIQEQLAAGVGVSVGKLTFVIKSAHIYDTEREYMETVTRSELTPSV
jgi:thymidylate synthase